MNARNCRRCGRIFTYVAGAPICPACKEEMEAKFQEVKEYIQNNRDTSIRTVAQECEVDENQIRQWVREERLVFAEDSGVTLQCELCGSRIYTGRYCDKCKQNTANTFMSAGRQPIQPQVQKKDTRENPRMRFLDR